MSKAIPLERITVTCGPGKLAYRLQSDGKVLEIWVGDQVDKAPSDATVIDVTEGHSAWVMKFVRQ